MAEFKTNVMRILDKAKVKYSALEYPHEDGVCVDGVTVAELVGIDPAGVFKTLVTKGSSKAYFVFVIPVAEELDLKKAAKAVGEKSVEMIHVSEINAVTGYIRGGCSPIGMKKKYPTYINDTAQNFDTDAVSAGVCGCTLLLSPSDLQKATECTFADIIKE